MKKNPNKMSSEMNVIWKKDKLQKYSKESIPSPALASGDGAEQQCRLCGASDQLQLITNDRLDETLRLYFGVQVPPEGVICESCIKCMKITEGFSALVHASFDKTVSEDSSRHTRILAEFSPGATNLPATNPQKEILSLLKTKLTFDAPRSRKREARRRITKTNSNVVFKKMIIACTVCRQKYPMFMPDDGVKKFVCSRCQKTNNCRKNNAQSSVNKIELRCKTDLKRKNKLYILPQQEKQNHSATKSHHLTRHQCSQCPKNYAIAENLATHIRTVHEGSSNRSVGGKKFKSKDNLEKNTQRSGLKNFPFFDKVKCSRALQSQFVSHEKQNKSLSS